MKTAILVDGGFYRKRAQSIFGVKPAEERAEELNNYCWRHLKERNVTHDLYRIFYYDCLPMDKKLYHPFMKQQVDFSQSDVYIWMNAFLDELKKKRKFALRMGKLADAQAHFSIRPNIVKKLCAGSMKFEDLQEKDFMLNVDQKGVDMKIGIDISSIAYKKQVEKIVLISGDSDFVPAAKLARREGIDFVLDPMGAAIKPDLFEHIDGLRSCDKLIHNNV